MKIGTIPIGVANRLQAIETTLDSLSQRNPTLRELKEALRLIRSVQRTMVGPRYVRERSLKRYTVSGSDPKKQNWRKWQKERDLKQNGTLVSMTPQLCICEFDWQKIDDEWILKNIDKTNCVIHSTEQSAGEEMTVTR